MYEQQDTDLETASLTDDIELEAGQVTLPRDVLRNRFTFDLSTSIPGMLIAQVVLPVLLVDVFDKRFIAIYMPLICSIVVLRSDEKRRAAIESEAFTAHFSQTVQKIIPKCSSEKWDVVAAEMNTFIYESGASKSPYHFYDGSACFANFRYHFVLPYYNHEATKTSACEDAVKSYQESLDEIWRESRNVVATPTEGMNVILPRDHFRSKLTYSLIAPKELLATEILFMGIVASFHVFLYFQGLRWDALQTTWELDLVAVLFLSLGAGFNRHVKDCTMTISNRMAFLEAFMRHRDGNVLQRWDHIAEDMNEVLSTCAEDPSPHFFYDGTACRAYFKRIFSIEPNKASFISRFKRPDKNAYPELSPYVQEVKNILEKEKI